MTKHDIAKLACKILAIMTTLILIEMITSLWYFYENLHKNWLVYPIPFLILGLAAWMLWWKADAITQAIFPIDEESGEGKKPTYTELQELAIGILGLYIMVLALPSIISNIMGFFTFYTQPNTPGYIPALRAIPSLVGNIIKYGLGMWLFFRPKSVMKLWARCQEWGMEKSASK